MTVLFLTHRLPYAPNRGDRVRAYHLLRSLRAHFDVDLVSLVHDDDEAGKAGDLASLASSVSIAKIPKLRNMARSLWALPSDVPVTHTMLDSPLLNDVIRRVVSARRPDVVFAYCSGMARLAMAHPLGNIPLVLDMVDVDSAKWAALAPVSSAPLSWVYEREARVLRRFEARVARRAVTNLVVTERERQTLAEIAPDANIEVVANGVDVEGLRPPGDPPMSQDVIFCGVMDYFPNEQAATFLASSVWPLVQARRPEAILRLVGANPPRTVRRLAEVDSSVQVTGTVPDVRPYLWQSAVSVAPLFTARGIQNKVLEAVAAGLPTVVTPNVFESLPGTVKNACSWGGTPQTVADAIVALLELLPAERRAIADRADMSALSWDRQLSRVGSILGNASRSLAGAQRVRA